jgi:hypothetical protein
MEPQRFPANKMRRDEAFARVCFKTGPFSFHACGIFHFASEIFPSLDPFWAHTAQNKRARSYSYIQAHKTYGCWQP